MSKKKRKNNRTSIEKHKKKGKKLEAPFSPFSQNSQSWKDDRLPEMLWATLVITNLEREKGLEFFRFVIRLCRDNNEFADVTHSGISQLDVEKKEEIIRKFCSYSDEVSLSLRPLILLEYLPDIDIWKQYLSESNPEEDWRIIGKAVLDCLDHQSQESTDCRWVRLMSAITTGKMLFPKGEKELVENFIGYPNMGDMHSVRPFIRSSELMLNMMFSENQSSWPELFWKTTFLQTLCMPIPHEKYDEPKQLEYKKLEEIRIKIIELFLDKDTYTSFDPKTDALLGNTLYALRLLSELSVTNLSRSATGRLVLRSLSEIYITLRYLTFKDSGEIWGNYRAYGVGQAKLCSLKDEDLAKKPNFFDNNLVKRIANEDKWEEFVDIELGNWDKSNLREMSIESNCKDIYDMYYSWTSTYTHGSWGAVRESTMDLCGNPLHRMHRIPCITIHPLPDTLNDSVFLMNKILKLISNEFENFQEIIELK